MKKIPPRNNIMPVSEALGIHLQGRMTIPYNVILSVLGSPNGRSNGQSIRAEWKFRNKGEIITVYDWYETKLLEDTTEWQIGGLNNSVIEIMKKLIPSANIMSNDEHYLESLKKL